MERLQFWRASRRDDGQAGPIRNHRFLRDRRRVSLEGVGQQEAGRRLDMSKPHQIQPLADNFLIDGKDLIFLSNRPDIRNARRVVKQQDRLTVGNVNRTRFAAIALQDNHRLSPKRRIASFCHLRLKQPMEVRVDRRPSWTESQQLEIPWARNAWSKYCCFRSSLNPLYCWPTSLSLRNSEVDSVSLLGRPSNVTEVRRRNRSATCWIPCPW